MVFLPNEEDIITWRNVHASSTIVAASGCFDFIHPGHVKLLRLARELADTLIVGMNSDASIKHLKGPKRPIYPVDDRILMLGLFGVWTPSLSLMTTKPPAFSKSSNPIFG